MLCNNNGKASCGSTLVYCKARYSKAGQKKRKIIIRVYLDTDAELEWLEQITQAFRISPRGKRKKKKDTSVTPWWHLTEVSKREVWRKIRLFCLSRLRVRAFPWGGNYPGYYCKRNVGKSGEWKKKWGECCHPENFFSFFAEKAVRSATSSVRNNQDWLREETRV